VPPIDAAVPVDARLPCIGGDDRIEDEASGACYIFFTADLSWAAAQAECALLGGHLATSTSLAENVLMSRIAPETEIWIGATDEASENNFVWVTSEPFAFVNWRAGEPNNGGSNGEHCAILEGENNVAGRGCLWDDRNCASGSSYLCERP